MVIDISQFHETFLEEASEHLQALESGLLELEQGSATDLNAIFRAAHSIKGGAGTFGFDTIANFTHVLENLLDKARENALEMDANTVTILLRSVDVIGDLITAAKEGREANNEEKDACQKELEERLEQASNAAPQNQEAAVSTTDEDEHKLIRIGFKPHPHFPKTGSDPLNIFKELSTLGEITTKANTTQVPPLADLETDSMYLSWELELQTDASTSEVSDAFMFVDTDADIDIQQYAGVDQLDEAATAAAAAAAAATDKTEEAAATTASQQEEPMAAAAAQTTTPAAEHRSGKDRRSTPDRRNGSEGQYIRVAIDKIDNLINMIGELVTSNAMVEQCTARIDMEQHNQLNGALLDSFRHTRNLQEAIMAIRMMPIDFAFSRFPRMVRDTSRKLGKTVNLETLGGQTELDKTVIEYITDPLTHLVRNAIDHGIEQPNERAAAGKTPEGTVTLSAYHRGGNVVIDIIDDGRGLNREKIVSKAIEKGIFTEEETQNISNEELWGVLFHSGFSTAKEVTDVSGRGVGMDVVKRNIESLGGTINIQSEEGKGSTFSISLPLTLAIVDGMAIQVGQQTYLLPLLNILESIHPTPDMIRTVQNGVELIDIRGEFFPLLRLREVFRVPERETRAKQRNDNDAHHPQGDGIAVLVESGTSRIALFVDELLGERQVVIKSVEDNYRSIEGVSGATILGDGSVAFIIDLAGVVKMAAREGNYRQLMAKPITTMPIETSATTQDLH